MGFLNNELDETKVTVGSKPEDASMEHLGAIASWYFEKSASSDAWDDVSRVPRK